MTVDTNRGLALVFMVQHAGFPGNGGQKQRCLPEGGERAVHLRQELGGQSSAAKSLSSECSTVTYTIHCR
jgi:hypothetical protein